MRNRVIYRSRAVEGWSAALVAGARSAVRPALRDALLELGCSPGYAAAARPSRDEFAAAARRVRSGV